MKIALKYILMLFIALFLYSYNYNLKTGNYLKNKIVRKKNGYVVKSITSNDKVNNRKSFKNKTISPTQKEIDSFYDEITLGTEFGEHSSQRYWYKEDVYIYLCDRQDSLYVKEITKIVEELNSLIETVNISVTPYKNKANLFLWISENHNTFIDGAGITSNKTISHLKVAAGMVVGRLKHTSNEIKFTYVFVHKTNDLNFDKCTLREEITQSLGFFRDTYSFSTSIFSQMKTEQVLEYTELDKAIIKKHYSK